MNTDQTYSRRLLVIFLAGCLLAWAGWSAAEEPAPSPAPAASIEELKSQVKTLKESIQKTESENSEASEELGQLRKKLNSLGIVESFWNVGQKIIHPTRILSPILSNAGFICAGIALLILILTRRATARRLLSLTYPFRVPSGKGAPVGQPMSSAARWVWIIILVMFLIFLALPAVAEEAAEAPAVPNEQEPPAEEAPKAGIEDKMEEAVKLVELTPTQRVILTLENAPENESITVHLGESVFAEIAKAAAEHNHPPLIKPEKPGETVRLSVAKGGFAYYIVLASLYEASGNPAAPETLKKGVELLPLDELVSSKSIPFSALNDLLLWLVAYDAKENARPLVLPCAKMAPDLREVERLLNLAEECGFTEEAPQIIEVNISRFTSLEGVEGLCELAQTKGFPELATETVTSAMPRFRNDISAALRLVRLLHELGDADLTRKEIENLADAASLQSLFAIAKTASDLNLSEQATDMLVRATDKVRAASHVNELLQLADKLASTKAVMEALKERLNESDSMADWGVNPVFPESFEAQRLDSEEVSLASLVGAQLFDGADAESFKALFERPVSPQLERIIKSMGVVSKMRLNDLYALARYYEITNDPAKDITEEMIAFQQQIRGLDKTGTGPSKEDAERLALMMETQQLQSEEAQIKSALAKTKTELSETREALRKTRIRIALLVLESIAKTVLILVGLWIAFSRAVAAARAAIDFCFSHFCWTFLETVGFECCCTIVLLFPGVLFVLLAQDRLKHLLITGTDRVAAAPLTSSDAPKEDPAKPSAPEKVEGQS